MKKYSVLILGILMFLGSALQAQKSVAGNGVMVTKEVEIGNFDELQLEASATVKYTQGEPCRCVVTIDENLLQYLDFNVKNGTLKIRQSEDGAKSAFSMSFGEKELNIKKPTKPIDLRSTQFVIEIIAPKLTEVNSLNAGNILFMNDYKAEELELNMSGSGSIQTRNLMVSDLEVNVSGSGSVKMDEVRAEKCDLKVAGSGLVSVNRATATEMDANMVGSGKINVNGSKIQKLNADVAGSGNIGVEGWIQNANAKSVGSGNIVLGTVEMLRYDLVGSGNVEYVGDNANVDGFSAGSGRIVKR